MDYMAVTPMMVLNGMIHVKNGPDRQHTVVFFEMSPRPFTDPVWEKMGAVGDGLRFR